MAHELDQLDGDLRARRDIAARRRVLGDAGDRGDLQLLGTQHHLDRIAVRGGLGELDRADVGRRRRTVRDRRHEVRVADEPRHPAGLGALVQLGRCSRLHDPAVGQHRDPVAEHERLVLVVGDEHRRDPQLHEQLVDLGAHLDPQRGVQVGERLVEQQHRGPRRDRSCERDPLLLAARERCRHPVAEPPETDQLQRLVDARRGTAVATGQAEPHVAGDGQVREERPVLEHHADAASLGRHEVVGAGQDRVADGDGPGVGDLEPGDDPQQRRLAAAAGTEQRQRGAGLDGDVDTVEHDDIVLEGLGHALGRDARTADRCDLIRRPPAPLPGQAPGSCSGRSVGNSTMSRIVCVSVRSWARRSIPMPTPTVGGRP